jgi:hypothetical protein
VLYRLLTVRVPGSERLKKQGFRPLAMELAGLELATSWVRSSVYVVTPRHAASGSRMATR